MAHKKRIHAPHDSSHKNKKNLSDSQCHYSEHSAPTRCSNCGCEISYSGNQNRQMGHEQRPFRMGDYNEGYTHAQRGGTHAYSRMGGQGRYQNQGNDYYSNRGYESQEPFENQYGYGQRGHQGSPYRNQESYANRFQGRGYGDEGQEMRQNYGNRGWQGNRFQDEGRLGGYEGSSDRDEEERDFSPSGNYRDFESDYENNPYRRGESADEYFQRLQDEDAERSYSRRNQ